MLCNLQLQLDQWSVTIIGKFTTKVTHIHATSPIMYTLCIIYSQPGRLPCTHQELTIGTHTCRGFCLQSYLRAQTAWPATCALTMHAGLLCCQHNLPMEELYLPSKAANRFHKDGYPVICITACALYSSQAGFHGVANIIHYTLLSAISLPLFPELHDCLLITNSRHPGKCFSNYVIVLFREPCSCRYIHDVGSMHWQVTESGQL